MWSRAYTALQLIKSVALTTTSATPSLTVDLGAYASLANREIKAVINTGTLTTTATMTFTIEECATTNGTWAAPANGTTSAVVTTAVVTEMNFLAQLRYVRMPYTLDATGSIPVGATLIVLARSA